MRFSFADADAAADELVRAAQSLLEAAAFLAHDVPDVTEEWTGRFREVFDVESTRHDAALRLLADELLSLAASVRARAIEAAVSGDA